VEVVIHLNILKLLNIKFMSYLGKEEILTVAEKGSDVQITFKGKDKQNIELNKGLFEIAKTDKPTELIPMDAVYNRLAKKMVIELADLGLSCIEVQTLVGQIGNLIHNRREAVVGEKFGVPNTQFIKLKDLL